MTLDIKQAGALVRDRVKAVLDPDPRNNLQKHVYQVVLVAEASLPNRKATVAYLLGVMAGAAFDIHDQLPAGAVFQAGTLEADEYITGFKDALLIGQAWQRAQHPLELGALFDALFVAPPAGEVK